MKIAVYQGFPYIHYEMLGYIIDYFLTSNIKIDIYAHLSEVGIDWLNFYEKIFNTHLVFIEPNIFVPESYDLIFLITDDDYSFKQQWLENFKNKIICIDHSAKIRRLPLDLTRIGTRFFYYRPKCLWALPICMYITKTEKLKYINESEKINVMCIGIQNRPISGEFLQTLFTNFDSIDFHVITRKLKSKYDNFTNIKTYENCSSYLMMELLKKSHYMLCFENPNNLEPIANSISAAVPLSFSVGCQLIIPESWQKYYNFTSVISYEDNLLQNNNNITKLTLFKNINLNNIYNECYQLISHRNRTFDIILNYKISETPSYCNNSSIYGKVMDIFTIDKPKILIDTSNNFINFIKEFREIHTLDINNISNNKNVFYHDNLSEFIDKYIFEPILIYLNEINYISRYLNYLSRRITNDIIIIEGISLDIEQFIKQYYKRKHSIYYINNQLTVVLPQI